MQSTYALNGVGFLKLDGENRKIIRFNSLPQTYRAYSIEDARKSPEYLGEDTIAGQPVIVLTYRGKTAADGRVFMSINYPGVILKQEFITSSRVTVMTAKTVKEQPITDSDFPPLPDWEWDDRAPDLK